MKFNMWSEWKKNALPHSLSFFTLLLLIYAVAIWRLWTKASALGGKLAAETGAAVVLIAILSFVIPLIGDGVTDIGKHLFLFNACFDLLAVGAVTYTVHAAALRVLGKLTSARKTISNLE